MTDPREWIAQAKARVGAADQALARFLNQRPQFVTALRNTPGDQDQDDYYRWTGHAEARRTLARSMGLPVPHEPGESVGALPGDLPRALAALEAVLDRHRPIDADLWGQRCMHDDRRWPCRTVRDITAALDGAS